MKRLNLILLAVCCVSTAHAIAQREEMSPEIQKMYYSEDIEVGRFDESFRRRLTIDLCKFQ